MTTALVTHPDCLSHLPPAGHPERVERLRAVLAALDAPAFAALRRVAAPEAGDDDLLLCHSQAHLDALAAALPDRGAVALDADTFLSPGSLRAARRGVGACLRAVDMVLGGEVGNAFAAVRPPGHHAETATPMGFCLFDNIAIAARHALERHGLARVAVVDFDVHHGNGTQDLLWNEPRALFVSTHQMPLWPGTGAPSERGGHDNAVNVALAPGTDGRAFRRAMEAQVLPRLEAFRPELLLISAGFDAHRDDPLAALELGVEDFAWATRALCDLARADCGGRVVSTLEGGYDLAALAASAAAHVAVLMERSG